jgi:hypothetical protein
MTARRGIVASSVAVDLPTVTINAVTNFNQDRATFNATVSANYQSTTVQFQYSRQSNFSTIDGTVTATGSPVSGQSTAVYYNATGLLNNTIYYVRAVATNAIGVTTTSGVSFTTWGVKEYKPGVAGYGSNATIQSITPTGGSAIAPTIYNVFLIGGGGGGTAFGGGAGGGGYSISSSRTLSASNSNTLTISIGGGGSADNNGGTSSISHATFSMSATGGVASAGGLSANGSNSGSGVNGVNGGGSGASASWVVGKTNVFAFASGGGGGAGGVGGNAIANQSQGGIGGNGGAGVTAYGYSGGAGGGGKGDNANGSKGTYNTYGSGGNGYDSSAGGAGLMYFYYYGP